VGVSSSLNPITPSSWQSDLTDTLDALNDHRVSLFEQYGLKPHFKISDAISPWLNIVFSTEEYMPRAVCENDFSFYVGDCLPLYNRGDETSFPFERLQSGKKIVYMSLGSQLYYHPQLFDCVSQALYETDIQLIFSLNELIHTPFANQLPANVIPVKYAPQIELLRHVDLMITHGGANSVMESLTQGIPVALLPICNDQFLQARFVKNANAGIVLDAFQPDPDVYRKQLLPLLEEDSAIRRSITKIRESFKRYGGAREAASLIMQLLNTKKPLMPV
jgi:MGT family glycosyltransferase